jgi:hypothetical protein
MDPNIANTGNTGAGQAAEGQTLAPPTNANQTTQRANTNPNVNRGSTQEGAQFSGPGTPGTQQQQTGYGGSNSS